MSWDQYSETPASNYLTGYFLTGMAPSSVKVAGSDIMADLAQFMSMPTSGGSANAQTITNTRQFGALFTGMWAVFVPGNTNTGSMTLAVDGLAAKNVFCNGAAALAGQVVSGIPAYCRYDGTQWQLVNPQRSTGSFTATLATGLTTTPSGTLNYAIEPSGKLVNCWNSSAITGTSNATGMTITGIPAAIVSTTNHSPLCKMEDNGGAILASITTNSTTWTVGAGTTLSATGFTSTGTKGIINVFVASWPLD